MKKNNILIIAVFIVIFTQMVTAAIAADSWFIRSDEGWFFYKEKPKPLPPKDQSQKAPDNNTRTETVDKPAHQIIKEHGELLLGEAMVDPTEDNVQAYMEFNKQMLDGANRFTKVWERVLAKNPDLYLTEYYSDDVNSNMRRAITKLSKSAGIFFFYRSDCPHCHKQVTSVLQLKDRYGFNVIAVSLDGGSIPQIQDITKKDNGISVMLNIKSVPAIYLAYPDENRFEPISQGGSLSITDIERRLYHYVQMESEPTHNFDLSDLDFNAR